MKTIITIICLFFGLNIFSQFNMEKDFNDVIKSIVLESSVENKLAIINDTETKYYVQFPKDTNNIHYQTTIELNQNKTLHLWPEKKIFIDDINKWMEVVKIDNKKKKTTLYYEIIVINNNRKEEVANHGKIIVVRKNDKWMFLKEK